ncbi:MAG: HlyC/CorC family transporter [Candidatus Tectomicrobia bacterium]|uniref:HlyC/CorC family transporter n=1 Tax=Tectimicrobiota bacterium TaxID=2528274 RepID=A0A938B3M0_UNCTE|nr:HlyC/CorC family transporter [Candidatus Tectomicrobia bacterium]
MGLGLWGEVVLVLLSVLVYGMLDGMEVALRAAQKSRLVQWKEEKQYGAAVALGIRETPEQFIMTLHIGMTCAAMVAAMCVGALTVGQGLPWLLSRWPMLGGWSGTLALGLAVLFLTYIVLVFGQLIPRAIAQQHPERVVCSLAPLLRLLTRLCKVVRTGLTASSSGVLWLFGQSRPLTFTTLAPITEEDVTSMVRAGAEQGIFETVEHELIAGVFEFTDTAAREIMIPRVRIQALDVNTPTDEVVQRLAELGYSRIPVYEGDLDHVVGVLYFKDVMRAVSAGRLWEMRRLLHPPLYVPEMIQISRLLRMLQQRRLHMAIVVDEHGGVAGLITTEDLLEQLVGDIRDEGEPEADALVTLLPDGAMVALGSAPLWELRERYQLPLAESAQYHTLAGLLLARLGHIPQGGEAIHEQGYTVTVVDMEGPRIARVKLERRSAEEPEGTVDMSASGPNAHSISG